MHPHPHTTGNTGSKRSVLVIADHLHRYQSANMGTFQTVELIETFINYHENIKKCVCIIYDPHSSTRGSLVLKAIRLKDSFIALHKAQKMTFKDLREADLAWKDVFVELPIRVHNSSLVQAVVADLMPSNVCTQVSNRRVCTRPQCTRSMDVHDWCLHMSREVYKQRRMPHSIQCRMP